MHETHTEEQGLKTKSFILSPEAIQRFEMLKAKEGPRSGPRLIAEAIDLVLMRHGEEPVGPLRPAANAGKRPARGAKATHGA